MKMMIENEAMKSRFPENLPPGWKSLLQGEASKPYFENLVRFLMSEYRSGKRIFPQQRNVLRALQEVDYNKVKVVILGQDPYHGAGQAMGLSFAVPRELFPKPPSLQNIFKELRSDLGVEVDQNQSELTGWAAQGVLLLNTVLTVRASEAFSHRGKGWENFTDEVIKKLNERERPVVFILWGAAAQKKKELLTGSRHFFLESPHPSPLSASRGFFGCRHFSKANEILLSLGQEPIDWKKTSL